MKQILWAAFAWPFILFFVPLFLFLAFIIVALKDWKEDSKVLDKHIGIEDEIRKKLSL